MAQRKGQSKQRRRRRRARRDGTPTVLVLLCLILTVVAMILAATIFFKIETITLTGSTRYSQQHVAEASGLKTGDNLVLFDKISVKEGIYQACPYLDTVQIRRRYPSGIEIIVTECEPVAIIQDEKAEVPIRRMRQRPSPSATPAAGSLTETANCWKIFLTPSIRN